MGSGSSAPGNSVSRRASPRPGVWNAGAQARRGLEMRGLARELPEGNMFMPFSELGGGGFSQAAEPAAEVVAPAPAAPPLRPPMPAFSPQLAPVMQFPFIPPWAGW